MQETETLDDASHSVQEDRPDRVVAAIRRVLERTQDQARIKVVRKCLSEGEAARGGLAEQQAFR